jgi:hypothetical protein
MGKAIAAVEQEECSLQHVQTDHNHPGKPKIQFKHATTPASNDKPSQFPPVVHTIPVPPCGLPQQQQNNNPALTHITKKETKQQLPHITNNRNQTKLKPTTQMQLQCKLPQIPHNKTSALQPQTTTTWKIHQRPHQTSSRGTQNGGKTPSADAVSVAGHHLQT